MINTPQDYKLVTPVGLINGGVLPVRDAAADGSAHVLRTEDACFLLEAARRICAYSFADPGSLVYGAEPGRELDVRPFVESVWGIHWGAVSTTSGDRTWPSVPALKSSGLIGPGWRYITDIVQYGTSGDVALWDGCLTPATVSAAESFVGSTQDFWRYELEQGNVRKLYQDLDSVKGVHASGSAIVAAGGTRRTREWYGDGTLSRDSARAYEGSSDIIDLDRPAAGGFWGPTQVDFSWQASGVDNPSAHPERLAVLSPTICWTLWAVSSTMYSEESSSYLERHVDGYVVDSTVTAEGDISFAATVSAAEILRLCVQAHGLYSDVWAMPEQRRERISVSCVGVMFYDAGVDVSG